MKRLIAYFYPILLFIGGIYASTPCTVKDTMWDSLGQEYVKPLNKNRSAAGQFESCSHSVQNSLTLFSAEKKSNYPESFLTNTLYFSAPSFSSNPETTFPGFRSYPEKSLPLYILYQCLKLDVKRS